MPPKTYSTTEINALAGTGWCFWRLDRLVRTGQVVPLNRQRGQERRFSEEEALKAVNILLDENYSSMNELLDELKERADGER